MSGPVAADYAVLFQFLDPFYRSRAGQTNPLAQLFHGNPAVDLEDIDDFQIDVIHVSPHKYLSKYILG
jgi:hypothetical protein